MTKLDDISVSIDNKGAYDGAGKLVLDPGQNAWVFWPTSIDDGITYMRDIDETLATIAEEYGASAYALHPRYAYAVIITPAAEAAGLDSELDLAGYTVVAI